MSVCARGIAVKQDEAGVEATPHRCKCWSCEICNPINRAAVIQAALDGKPKALLTLTVSSAAHAEAAEAASVLKRALRLLRLRLKRHPRLQDFQFLAVFEAHKSGHPHLHLLIRGGFLPWHWLRKVWPEISGSTHIDIRKIKGRKDAARYVAKYIGKDLHAFEGCKRWWRSHGYDLKKQEDQNATRANSPWWHSSVALSQLAEALEAAAWTITAQKRHRLAAIPDESSPEPADEALRRWRIGQRGKP